MKIGTNHPNPINVAIIGAGLGGLCLAQGLRKEGVTFRVFEKDASPYSRAQGYRIRIDETGQQALFQCLPENLYQTFAATSVPSLQVNTLNAQLQPAEKWVSSWNDGKTTAPPDLKVNRLTLREILLTGLEESVEFNKKLIDYENHDDGNIRVDFEDGTHYIADIVVAADGINSTLGALRFPENKIADTGSVCIYGKTFYTDMVKDQVAVILQADTTVVFENGLAMIADAMQFGDAFSQTDLPLTATEDYIYWALIGNRDRLKLTETENLRLLPEEIDNVIAEATCSWLASLRALFYCGQPETLTVVPVRTSLPKRPWVADAVTALGDAIHAMSPAGGLGANTALYDAAILAEQIGLVVKGEKDKFAAISDYEEEMRRHSVTAVETSQNGAAKLYDQKTGT